jgi:hypothetical protein
MNTRTAVVLSAAALTISVAGCAEMASSPQRANVPVTVTVSGCNDAGITVAPDPVRITQPSTIKWSVSSGYDFPATNAVRFKGAPDPQPPAGVFSPGNRPQAGTFTVDDDHTQNVNNPPPSKGYWRYNITVIKADGSPCHIKDPTVWND